jgi:ubiquitin C-terminal hydrolase
VRRKDRERKSGEGLSRLTQEERDEKKRKKKESKRKYNKGLTQEQRDEVNRKNRESYKNRESQRKSREGLTKEERDEEKRKKNESRRKRKERLTQKSGMQSKLREAVRKHMQSEHELLGSAETRLNMDIEAAQQQVTNHVREAPSPDLWHCDDGYFVTPINYSHETSEMRCSIEACQPIVLQDGIARIHAASNLTVTRLYANGLCGTHSSIVLRVFHDLDASTSPSEQQELIERMDNLHLIRQQIPFSKKARLAMPFEPDFAEQLSIQHETGVATLEGCRRLAGRPDLWRISSFITLSTNTKKEYEDLPAIDAVVQFVTDLESTSERKLRRMNGVPYPFHGGPEIPHWSWAMFYKFMGFRLKRLKRFCNRRHITTFGIPELICAVLYLLYNGRSAQPSQLLDVPVCIFDKHPLCMSIGKANHKAGMTAGFSAQLPLSFKTFKADEVNVCVEPWLCNASKGDRDDQVDTIRRDFRDNLKIANLPYWPAELAPLDEGVRERYIQNASAIVGELENEISDEDVPRKFDEVGDESDNEESDDDESDDDESDDDESDDEESDDEESGDEESDDGEEDEGDDENKIGHDASKKTGTGDPGSGNASGGGDSNTSSTLTIVPGKRNMSNLAATCYMSTVLQVLHNNEGIRRYIMDPENFVFKVQTGVSDDEFLKTDLSTRNAQEIFDAREARLAAMQPLVFSLRQLFQELDSGGDQLMSTDTQDILGSVQLIDDRWENKPNESAELMNTILTTLVTASDRSDPSARGAYAYAARTRNSLAPEPILEDADNALRLYRAEGRDTKLSELLHTQYVSEVPCADCPSVSRSFEHTFVKYLALPNAQPGQNFTLEDVLSQFYIEYLTDGLPCKVDGTHTPSFMNHRRVSFGADYICFAIQRGHSGIMELLNQVAFPEQIDLGRIMDMQHLPSNTHTHQPRKQIVPIKKSPYELVAVNNWVGRHYIAYVRDPTDGSWVMFNDLQSHPKKKSPMDGWREGEIVHYGIYKRLSAPDTEPRASSMVHEENYQDQTSAGVSGTNDDDATMHQHGDDGMVTQQHGDGGTPATPARPAHEHSNVASPSYTSPLSPNARKNRRQLSSDITAGKQITAKTSRGSLHGDISAAKHEEALKARENDLKTQEAQLRSAEAQNNRREAQLRDQQAEQDRRAQALQDAELEVTHLRERAQRADELENILGGLREQRTSMLQSIEGLRANLVTRQTSYQNELMFISSQSNVIEAQIKELQQSMEDFRVQRDDATARYQQDKAEMEAQINRLQEEIIALFT